MASRTQSEKIISDVEDCVAELLKDFSISKLPINDDNIALHRFEEKLEFVLQHGMKEKLNILGSKKSYWDYIYASFSSSKRTHDGLKYVKSMHELKTSIGRGRAFIRFCLMHKCLADTLQICFTNHKVTNDYYHEKSVPAQGKYSSAFIDSLYELNELNFDLTPRHVDLDISWPTFARKLFISSEDLNPPSRNHSITSLSSQNNLDITAHESDHLVAEEQGLKMRVRENNFEFSDVKMNIDGMDADCSEVRNENFSMACAIASLKDVDNVEKDSCNSTDINSQTEELRIKSLEYENQQLLQKVSELECLLKEKENNYHLQASKVEPSKTSTTQVCDNNADIVQASPTEKYIKCISKLMLQQDKVINELDKKMIASINENNNLYSKMCILRDLLHSYGLLKASGKDPIVPKPTFVPLTVSNTDISDESMNSDLHNLMPLLNDDMTSIIENFKCSSSKFKCLDTKIDELQCGIETSKILSDNLLSRVQDHEMRLKGVTKELEEAQVLVSVMKEQHQKLQSAEGILKYDLQEKRKLLTRLKKQLESTREDWNRVRQKNSKSEAEWKDLRNEFVLRHKQSSEESGFIDDKSLEEQIDISKHVNDKEIVASSNITSSSENSDMINEVVDEVKEKEEVAQKKSRLEILEEQCQLLYSSLLQSSTKRQELDNRLESIYKGVERTSNKKVSQNINISVKIPEIHASECAADTLSEECAGNEDLSGGSQTEPSSWNGIQTSSEIGSLNSDCSLSPHASCTQRNSLDIDSLSEIPYENQNAPCDISYSEETNQLTSEEFGTNQTLNDTDGVSVLLSDSDRGTTSFPTYDDFQRDLVSDLGTAQSNSVEIFKNEDANLTNSTLPLSQVDSLIIKKKDLENSIEHLQMHNKFNSSRETIRKYKQERQEYIEEIFTLKSENELLQKEITDLKDKLLILETQLVQSSRQLTLSKATKEQEIAALQFQLNTEALKYERALKQFMEQDDGLKDMKQKVSDQEQLICSLEDALAEMKLEREYEKENRWQELEEIQFALLSREEECLVLSRDLEKLQEVKAHSLQDKESMEAELSRLRNDSKDLAKKLIKLLKEKDFLWKKTDHLSHLQKIKISDRWMADHEVSNCLGCRSRFSIIVRKHHCRLCGRIFCYSCCNNWILTTASRRKSRICNECYKLHLEMKQEARRGSDVPCLDDDSGDEVSELYTHPTSSCSFNSETSHGMANSIVSLPGSGFHAPKKDFHQFASAPDLSRYDEKNDLKLDSSSVICESLVKKDEDQNNANFDVLSDEEITKSLSTCGYYDLSGDTIQYTEGNAVSGISKTQTRTSTEIKAAIDGITGELWVNAGMICSFPILSEDPPTELFWSFICDSESIPISLSYNESQDECQQVKICNSEHKMIDHTQLLLPGLYTLHFDNSTSSMAQKLQYTFRIDCDPAKNIS